MSPGVVEALVQTGTRETPYWRAGQGRCVLLLTERRASPPPLLLGLAASFRVTAPAPPPGLGDPIPQNGGLGGHEWNGDGVDPGALWLRGVIDGLGLDRPGVVADHRYGPFMDRFAVSDPDRVGRVVVIPLDVTDLGELVRWVADELQDD